jgi:glucosyl-3-phosphoglycerate synthase
MNSSANYSRAICIPARNEAKTIGSVVMSLKRAINQRSNFDCDVLVIDDRSNDQTAEIAQECGVNVVSTRTLCQKFGGSNGKGDAIYASLVSCTSDLIAWVDGDLGELEPEKILQMFQPLETDPRVHLVKGGFTRWVNGAEGEEGRVTALTARPLLELLHPTFNFLSQPLSGMFAARRNVVGGLWLDYDYGVDIGIALDIFQMYGPTAIAEVDLGRISHRQRSIAQLAITASNVARAIVSRAGISNSVVRDFEYRRSPALGRFAIKDKKQFVTTL